METSEAMFYSTEIFGGRAFQWVAESRCDLEANPFTFLASSTNRIEDRFRIY